MVGGTLPRGKRHIITSGIRLCTYYTEKYKVNRGMVDNRADNTEFLRMVELHILLYILMLACQMSGCPGLLACFRFIISQAQAKERGWALASFSKTNRCPIFLRFMLFVKHFVVTISLYPRGSPLSDRAPILPQDQIFADICFEQYRSPFDGQIHNIFEM